MSAEGTRRPRNVFGSLRERWFRPVQVDIAAVNARVEAVAQELLVLRNMDASVTAEIQRLRYTMGSIQATAARRAVSLRDAEYKTYSQFGEDGAIQWLLANVEIENQNFIEFGVGDYAESNTRFLLEHDNWTGLIIDAGTNHIDFINRAGLTWQFTIQAQSAFVTAENINDLLANEPVDTGLLSVDIDGVDYWVLSAITNLRPRIVVCEYNSLFGPTATVSVPYAPAFDRHSAHPSMLYFGASISALGHWASERGYRLVGSSAEGVNAYFVRDDVAGDLPRLTGPEAWVETRIRQARGADGELVFASGMKKQRQMMAALPLVDVTNGSRLTVADLK